MADARTRFDPLGLIAALDRHRVAYIVVGAFARVIQGAEEITRGVDIVPAMKPENLRRLDAALDELAARHADGREAASGELENSQRLEVVTDRGDLRIVVQPLGTGGYDDLRRAATREPLGRGLRPSVASIDDLARMLAARGREEDRAKLRALRRLAEMERGLEVSL